MMIVLTLILSVLVSGLLALPVQTQNKTRLKLIVAFSGAYLFTITICKIIPEIYKAGTAVNIGIFILAGFFIQVLLEYLSHGIEHGHAHDHHNHKAAVFTISTGLFIHSIFEGMPLANPQLGFANALLAGIVMHNLPVGFTYASMLLQWGVSKTKTLLLLGVFSLMAPLGMLCCYLLEQSGIHVNEGSFYTSIMAMVVGIFLHISTTILYESSEHHTFNRVKFIVIIVGAMLAIAL